MVLYAAASVKSYSKNLNSKEPVEVEASYSLLRELDRNESFINMNTFSRSE